MVYGSIQPQVKEALKTLSEWYSKEYLDKEFIVKDFDKAVEIWQAGDALSMETMWWANWGWNAELYKNNNDSRVAGGPYLKGLEGERGVMIDLFNNQGTAISSKCEHPEAVFYQFNLYLESAYRSHKDLQDKFDFSYPYEYTQEPINLEEIEAAQEEDKKVFAKFNYSHPGPGNGSDGMYFNTEFFWPNQYGITLNQRANQLRNQFLTIADAYENDTLDQLAPQDLNAYEGMFFSIDPLRVAHFNNMKLAVEMDKYVKINAFMGAPTTTMVEKDAYLKKIEQETFSKIIMGQASLDEFDKFVEQWNKNGGLEITEEVNEWLKSTNN